MREILVTKDLAYGKAGGGTVTGFKDIDTLDAGAIAFLTETGVLIPAATGADAAAKRASVRTAVAGAKHIYIAVGGVDGTKISQLIPSDKALVRAEQRGYKAAVQQVVEIDDLSADSASLSVDDVEAIVKVRDLGNGVYPPDPHQQVSVRITAAMTEFEDVVDALIAAYNAKFPSASRYATLSKSGSAHAAKLVCTAPADKIISVAVDGILINCSVATVTDATFSEGKGTSVVKMETEFSTERGNTNQTWQSDLWWGETLETVVGTNYDFSTFEWVKTHQSSMNNQNVTRQTTVVAVPDGASATGAAAVLTVIEALYSEAYE